MKSGRMDDNLAATCSHLYFAGNMSEQNPLPHTAGEPPHGARRIAAEGRVSGIIVSVVCAASLILSIIESRLNSDGHHWGLMYANAVDLVRGLVPYREIFVQYGFLTTLIQGLSLFLFGNNVVSVGVITGISYSVTLYLTYLLLRKVMRQWLACMSVVVMFLVHGYILYPWSNYFSYTFFLPVILFLTAQKPKPLHYLLAGVFLGLSFLARQSLIPLLAPLYLYFLFPYVFPLHGMKKAGYRALGLFHAGLAGVLGIFILYLVLSSAFYDWYAQSFTLLGIYGKEFGGRELLSGFLRGVFLAHGYPFRDGRQMLYSIIFFNALLIWLIVAWSLVRNKESERRNMLIFLFASITLFGYLQSFHIYEVFRLQNASSLGIGLLLYSLDYCVAPFKRWKTAAFAVPVSCLVLYLGSHFLFIHTSSVYFPWDKKQLFGHGLREPRNIPILKGKLYDSSTINYYESLTAEINQYQGRLDYLVNYSNNSFVPLLSPAVKRVQRSPFYSKEFEQVLFNGESESVGRLLRDGRAILTAGKPELVPPDYAVVLTLENPDLYLAIPAGIARHEDISTK